MQKVTKNIFIAFLIIVVFSGICCSPKIEEFIMKSVYPRAYAEYVYKYAKQYGIDPMLVFAVIKTESNFKNDVVSSRNAKGLMQIMDTTAEDVAQKVILSESFESDMLFDAETNIKIGTKYLSDLMQKYGNYHVAVVAYNAGTGTVDKWIDSGIIKSDGSDIENVPYKETNNYVRKIVRDYETYTKLYG